MNPALETTWLLKHTIENSELVTAIGSNFHVEIEPSIKSELTLYDNFGADLWKADFMLCRSDKHLFQLTKGTKYLGDVRATAKARFWWEFPDSEVKRHLKKKIGLRAVMPVASLELVSSNFSLRNSDDKITARGQLLQSEANGCTRHYLTLQPMRGYKKDFLQARKLLKSVFEQEVPEFSLKTIFIEQNLAPDVKDTVQALHLSPDMPTELAVRAMATEMIDEATLHVDGIVSDIDTVFLHQFRVSVRKIRSLISLLKKSLPPSTVDAIAPRLSEIAGRTSMLRDLDVFLLDKNHYRAMLPDIHGTGLDELFVLVEKQRQQEKNRVARYFKSAQYLQDISTCKAELSEAPVFKTSISKKSVLSVARSMLIMRYKDIQSMSAKLNAESDEEDVHDIRKEFKKLRYLIEFFIELLPRKRTARLIKRLKNLQITLGQFNDYCVQIEFLSSVSDDRQIEMTKSVSGLIAILHRGKIETRNQVEAALAHFFTDEMAMEVELAFGKKNHGRIGMKVIACYSMKGGVGKTATAVNLAYFAAKSGQKTLLIDLDPQGASSFYFRVKPSSKKWGERFFKAYKSLVKNIKASDFENLDIIPAHLSFRNFDAMLSDLKKRDNRLKRLLKGFRKEYDLVILDCPPSLSYLSEAIFIASDVVLVPVIPTTLSERTFEQLILFFHEKKFPLKKIVPFFSMVQAQKSLHKATMEGMAIRRKVFLKSTIPYSSDIEKMGQHKAPVDLFARSTRANAAYVKLWAEISKKYL